MFVFLYTKSWQAKASNTCRDTNKSMSYVACLVCYLPSPLPQKMREEVQTKVCAGSLMKVRRRQHKVFTLKPSDCDPCGAQPLDCLVLETTTTTILLTYSGVLPAKSRSLKRGMLNDSFKQPSTQSASILLSLESLLLREIQDDDWLIEDMWHLMKKILFSWFYFASSSSRWHRTRIICNTEARTLCILLLRMLVQTATSSRTSIRQTRRDRKMHSHLLAWQHSPKQVPANAWVAEQKNQSLMYQTFLKNDDATRSRAPSEINCYEFCNLASARQIFSFQDIL